MNDACFWRSKDRSLRFVFCRDGHDFPPSFARDEGAPAKEETEEFNDFGLREVADDASAPRWVRTQEIHDLPGEKCPTNGVYMGIFTQSIYVGRVV